MKKLFTAFCLSIFILSPAFAKKPDWAGNGKPTVNQSEAIKTTIVSQIDGEIGKDTNGKLKKEKLKKDKLKKEKPEGLEKQKQKKTNQVQKELGKGSEKGQESREQRKKWWKFWGE